MKKRPLNIVIFTVLVLGIALFASLLSSAATPLGTGYTNSDWGKTNADIIKTVTYEVENGNTLKATVTIDLSHVSATLLKKSVKAIGFTWYDNNGIARSGVVSDYDAEKKTYTFPVATGLRERKYWKIEAYLASDVNAATPIAEPTLLTIITPNIQYEFYFGTIGMMDGDYLAVGAEMTTGEKPEGGYAYYKDGRLVLNNFSYKREGISKDFTAALHTQKDLEIFLIGDNSITMSGYPQSKGIFVNSDHLVINAEPDATLTVTGPQYAIFCKGDVTINNGNISASSPGFGIGVGNGDLVFKNGTFLAEGLLDTLNEDARAVEIKNGTFLFPNNMILEADYGRSYPSEDDPTRFNKCYSIKLLPPTVFVGGVPMVPGDYLANGATETTKTKPSGGYAYLEGDGILLNNFYYKGAGYPYEEGLSAVIYSKHHLSISAEGDNTIIQTNPESDGIRIEDEDVSIFTQDGSTLTVIAPMHAIFGSTSVEIGGDGTVKADGWYGIRSVKESVTIGSHNDNGMVYATGQYAIYSDDGSLNAVNGRLVAKSIPRDENAPHCAVLLKSIYWHSNITLKNCIYAAITPNGPQEIFDKTKMNSYNLIIIDQADVFVAGVSMSHGEYLANGSTKPTITKPEGGYAYYSNGVLTLNNFNLENADLSAYIRSRISLTIKLVGKNSLKQYRYSLNYSRGIHIDPRDTEDAPVLVFEGGPEDSLTITSQYIGISIYGEGALVLNGGSLDIQYPKLGKGLSISNLIVKDGEINIKPISTTDPIHQYALYCRSIQAAGHLCVLASMASESTLEPCSVEKIRDYQIFCIRKTHLLTKMSAQIAGSEQSKEYYSCLCGRLFADEKTAFEIKDLDAWLNCVGNSPTEKHTFDQEIPTVSYLASAATCTAPATYYKSCKCGAIGTETFPHGETVAHVPSRWKNDQTSHWIECTVAGCGAVISGTKEAHTPDRTNATEDFAVKCTVCDYEIEARRKQHTHVFDKVVASDPYLAKPATCTTPAVYYKSCECGAIGTETIPVGEAPGHFHAEQESDKTHHWMQCTATGCGAIISGTKTEHTPNYTGSATACYAITCIDCGYVIDPLRGHAHVFNKEVAEKAYLKKEATCTSPAVYYRSCECGAVGTETFTHGTALGHTEGIEWMQDKTNHWHVCSVNGCEEIIQGSIHAHLDINEDYRCDVCMYRLERPTDTDTTNSTTDTAATETNTTTDSVTEETGATTDSATTETDATEESGTSGTDAGTTTDSATTETNSTTDPATEKTDVTTDSATTETDATEESGTSETDVSATTDSKKTETDRDTDPEAPGTLLWIVIGAGVAAVGIAGTILLMTKKKK